MLDSLIKSFEQLFLKPDFKRLSFFIFIIILTVIIFTIFEFFTGYCFYSQALKKIDALDKLKDLENKGILESADLKPIYKDIHFSLKANRIKPFAPKVALLPLIKFISAAIIPIIFFFKSIYKVTKRESDGQNMLIGSLIMLIIFGIIGVLIPTLWKSWANPVLYLFIQFIILVIFTIRNKRKKQHGVAS